MSAARDAEGEVVALLPEEIDYIREEVAQERRCRRCVHLLTFHQYNGGGDLCVICGCEP